MDTVRIFDTTLRDGEQSPGFSMNTAEKLRLARRLEALGVDVHVTVTHKPHLWSHAQVVEDFWSTAGGLEFGYQAPFAEAGR